MKPALELLRELRVRSRVYGPDAAPALTHDWLALRVFSRLLDADVWLVYRTADVTQLETELAAGGESTPVIFTVDEVLPLVNMFETDRRTLLATLARIKRAMPGATLEGMTLRGEAMQ